MSSEYKVYTPEEVAKFLKIGMNQVYKLIHSNEIKFLRIGKLIRIPETYLFEYIENSICNNMRKDSSDES